MQINDLEVTHGHATVNGVRLHYVERGRGPLVLLLHGFPEHWWSWRHQIAPLAAAGLRVVAPDLRGYNDSERQGPYDLDTLAADVCALAAHLGDPRPRIVGHDWGGVIAWHLAATRPEACARLAVLNAPHPAAFERALLRHPSQLRRSWYILLFQLPRLPEWLLSRRGGAAVRAALREAAVDQTRFGDEELAPFVEAALRPGALAAMLAYYRTGARRMVRRQRPSAPYQPIAAPTLLVWGKEDPALGYDELVPRHARWATDLRVEPIERCGHFVHAERPDEVNALLLPFLTAAP